MYSFRNRPRARLHPQQSGTLAASLLLAQTSSWAKEFSFLIPLCWEKTDIRYFPLFFRVGVDIAALGDLGTVPYPPKIEVAPWCCPQSVPSPGPPG